MKKSNIIKNILILFLLITIIFLVAHIFYYKQNTINHSILYHNPSKVNKGNAIMIYNFNCYDKCVYTVGIFTLDNGESSVNDFYDELTREANDNYDIRINGNTVYFKTNIYNGKTFEEITHNYNSTESNYYFYDLLE